MKKLLTADLGKRFGNLKNGVDDIKKCKWFSGLSWEALLKLVRAWVLLRCTTEFTARAAVRGCIRNCESFVVHTPASLCPTLILE